MDGIEKITARIAEDAEQEIAGLEREAQDQVRQIRARYEAQAQKESADLLARGRKAAQERVERLESVARLEAKKDLLAAKQEMIGRAFDQALDQLAQLPEEDYVALLTRLAVRAAQTGREKVVLSQKDRTRVGTRVVTQANEQLGDRGRLTLAEQTRPLRGGLVLLGDRVEVNCGFETLVRLQKEDMAGQIARVLFESGT